VLRYKEGSWREVKTGGNEKGEGGEGKTDDEPATPVEEARGVYVEMRA
jgi:hypothetical protein